LSGTRLGLFDGRLLTLFPRALLNTALSPTLVVKDKQARQIVNIIPNTNKAGSGAKRFGLVAKGAAAVGSTLVGEPFEYRKGDGTIQFIQYFSDGSLWTLNESTGVYTSIKTGLNVLGTVGAVPFNNKLIFYNGMNQPFSWDGASCTDLGEYVTDVLAATSPTQTSTSQFTLQPGGVRGASDYPNGRAIRVTFATAGVISAVVASTSYNAGTNTLTVNVTGTPFPNPNQVISTVEYFAKPPAFSFMDAEFDMLWGLSPGELKAKVYRGADGMKVYYQAALNNENSWYDYVGSAPTQDVPYINLRNKARVFDELVAISTIDGNRCFHGRNQLYIYSGDDPSTAGSFVWVKTIPVGTVHQKLVQRFPGDTLFFTPYGARSLRRVFQTEAAEVVPDLGSDIDPTVQSKINTLFSGDAEYKKARSFYYARDGLYGFKLDDESLLVYVLSEQSKGWVLFTGYFADAQGFLGTTDGRLLVSRSSQLYVYANGTDAIGGTTYSDGGTPIECRWWLPWIQTGGRWSNHAVEVLIEQSVEGTIYLDRFTDYNEQDVVTSTALVTGSGPMWDEAQLDVDLWDGVTSNPVVSDKFLCDNFSYLLRHNDTDGPRSILGIRPIGR
jgi:hypothetical protein